MVVDTISIAMSLPWRSEEKCTRNSTKRVTIPVEIVTHSPRVLVSVLHITHTWIYEYHRMIEWPVGTSPDFTSTLPPAHAIWVVIYKNWEHTPTVSQSGLVHRNVNIILDHFLSLLHQKGCCLTPFWFGLTSSNLCSDYFRLPACVYGSPWPKVQPSLLFWFLLIFINLFSLGLSKLFVILFLI